MYTSGTGICGLVPEKYTVGHTFYNVMLYYLSLLSHLEVKM